MIEMTQIVEEFTEEEMLIALRDYEGYFDIEEARLTYQARKKLPASAFCGPKRTYPAHDAAHVRNGIARLGTFGHRLPPATRKRIFNCLRARARRMGIEVSEDVLKKYKKKATETLQWYLGKFKSAGEKCASC